MSPQTVTGTFIDSSHAEDAQDYLLANDFTEDEISIKPNDTNGSVLSIAAKDSIEAQEAVDVLRNYGAVDIVLHSS